jgi:hypothetical protein
MTTALKVIALAGVLSTCSLAQADVEGPSYFFSGEVGGYPIIGELTIHQGDEVDGYYRYTHNGSEFRLSGTFKTELAGNASQVHLEERKEDDTGQQPKGPALATFDGNWESARFSGTWSNKAGKSLAFSIRGVPFVRDVRTSPSFQKEMSYPDFNDKAVRSAILKTVEADSDVGDASTLGVSVQSDDVRVDYMSARYLSLSDVRSEIDPSMPHAHISVQGLFFEKKGSAWLPLPKGIVSSSKECATKAGTLLRRELLAQGAEGVINNRFTAEQLFGIADWSLQFNGALAGYGMDSVGNYGDTYDVSLNRSELGDCLLTAPE